jgi:hypothetical protein
MEQIKIEFVRERETKNTIRFAEETTEDQAQAVGTLYVQRWALGQMAKALGHSVDRLTVTIEAK